MVFLEFQLFLFFAPIPKNVLFYFYSHFSCSFLAWAWLVPEVAKGQGAEVEKSVHGMGEGQCYCIPKNQPLPKHFRKKTSKSAKHACHYAIKKTDPLK